MLLWRESAKQNASAHQCGGKASQRVSERARAKDSTCESEREKEKNTPTRGRSPETICLDFRIIFIKLPFCQREKKNATFHRTKISLTKCSILSPALQLTLGVQRHTEGELVCSLESLSLSLSHAQTRKKKRGKMVRGHSPCMHPSRPRPAPHLLSHILKSVPRLRKPSPQWRGNLQRARHTPMGSARLPRHSCAGERAADTNAADRAVLAPRDASCKPTVQKGRAWGSRAWRSQLSVIVVGAAAAVTTSTTQTQQQQKRCGMPRWKTLAASVRTTHLQTWPRASAAPAR